MDVITFWVLIIGLPILMLVNLIIISNKIKYLINLNKKHQFDIGYICDITSKIAIKQKFIFFMFLILNDETNEYGMENMRRYFEISSDILKDKEKLIDFFEKITQEDSFNISTKNGKYIFEFKNK